ncbi:MAG: hypothetical protein MZU91_08935 [Desulfosudis oleivorans]|nr:hypothetical protein [Desulfosudis oleivorans]
MFTAEVPEEDDIRRILHAGLLGPYAAAAVGGSKDYFRRFFVMKKGSQGLKMAIPLMHGTGNCDGTGTRKGDGSEPGTPPEGGTRSCGGWR